MEDGKVMIKIIYEDNHLLVVEKPINVPVQLDSSNDEDLLSILKKYLKKKYNKNGNVYLGLVHRLDRPVSGIMVFAKTSKAASRLSEQIRKNEFKKTYIAVVCGSLSNKAILRDKLIKDYKTNMVRVSKDGKEAILDYEIISKQNNLNLVKINLITGRAHQIRVQFASRNNPLFGDQRYNKDAKVGQQIALVAIELEFMHPTLKRVMKFKLDLPERYPFSVFKNCS